MLKRADHGACQLAAAAMAVGIVLTSQGALAGPVVRRAAGANASAIEATVDQFRADLGVVDNGSAPGPLAGGHREITWDDVPEALASPQRLPADFFNIVAARGVMLSTAGTGFQVSNTAQPRFSNYKSVYADDFTTFSPDRLFTAEGSNVVTVTFRVPGTDRPATVSGFGVVFTDVDGASSASIEYFDEHDARLPLPLGSGTPLPSDGGLSFMGVSFDAGERIARVRITSGQAILTTSVVNPFATEAVAMDDFLYSEPQASTAPAAIDTRFAAGLYASSPEVFATQALAIQSDGKVVIAGGATPGSTSTVAPADMSVARLNHDGSLDTTFGTNGYAFVDFGGSERASAVAVLANGRIVVAGRTFPTGGGPFSVAVATLLPDGTLDSSFNGTGRVTSGPGEATAVVADVAGRVLVAATVGQDFAVLRFLPDGTLDPTFNPVAAPLPDHGNGRIRLDVGGSEDLADIALQRDGTMVLAGSTRQSGSSSFAVVRLLTSGIPDTTFGTAGVAVVDFEGDQVASAVAILPDGRVVVAGTADMGSDFAVARLLPDGSLDPSFNPGSTSGAGRTIVDFGSLETLGAMALQADGRIVLAGLTNGVGSPDPAVARLKATGELDPTFGIGGRAVYDRFEAAALHAVSVDPAGRILVAGAKSPSSGTIAFRLIGGPAPGIQITGPTTEMSAQSTTPFAAVRGMAGDVLGVTAVTWTSNHGFAGVASGTTEWTAEVPLLAGSNVITVTARDADGNTSTDTITVNVDEFVYYLSEGATGPFFDLNILLANPTGTPAEVSISYLKPDGSTVPQTFTLGAYTRRTVNVEELAGLEDTALSAVVRSTNAVPLVVERSMFWDGSYYGGHTGNAVDAPAVRWLFGEGSQGFFDTYILLANANSQAAQTTVTFLVEGGPNVVRTYDVAPMSRLNVYAGTIAELASKSFSIVVTSTLPIIAERAMYFGDRLFEGGHESAGISEPATSWFHAEGATGSYFDTYILVGNPNPRPANLTVTFLKGDGTSLVRQKQVPASGRLTLFVDGEDPALSDTAVSTTIVSDIPVVSERAMYWAGTSGTWFEAHNSFGVTSTARKWALAEGRVGGAPEFETYVLIANPTTETAHVRATFLRADGGTIVKTYDVLPTSRFNIWVNAMVPELQNEHFGVLVDVVNDVPVAVERALYWKAGGVDFAGGTNATAVRVP